LRRQTTVCQIEYSTIRTFIPWEIFFAAIC
jgi:hypothetical protein